MNRLQKYLKTNFIEKSMVLIDILKKVARSGWKIPFSNRAPSWSNSRAAEYLNFILGGNSLGYGTIWEAPQDLKVNVQKLLAKPIEFHNAMEFVEKYILDSGNRIRLFTSIILDKAYQNHKILI